MERVKVKNIIEEFKRDFKYLFEAGAEIRGVYGVLEEVKTEGELSIAISQGLEDDDLVNPFNCHIALWVNFFTDHRKIPKFYKGIKVEVVVRDDTEPDEFKFDDGTKDFYTLEEINFPQRYIDYVLDNKEKIRKKLGDETMTIKDMLDALYWGDFDKYKANYLKY